MKFSLISFSSDGAALLKSLSMELARRGEVCEGYISEKYRDSEDPVIVKTLASSASEWAGEQFAKADCLVFIGAAGIAVRSIAPWIKDKYTDPAVVVVDDEAHFAISLLSGHAGMANEITLRIAHILNATPVITTSSDVHGIYAVDEWARKLGLTLTDAKAAKEMAARVLDGGFLGFQEDPLCAGYCAYKAEEAGVPLRPDNCDEANDDDPVICVTPRAEVRSDKEILRLIPPCVAVGTGCRKGVEASVITDVIEKVLEREGLDKKAVFCVASVDLKNREPGLVAAAQALSVPFTTFPSAFLDAIPGQFSESEFVREVTGTGNICERAAFAAALRREDHMPAKLLTEKYAENGVTVALAMPDYSAAGR